MRSELSISAGLAFSVLIHAGAVYVASQGVLDAKRVPDPNAASWSDGIDLMPPERSAASPEPAASPTSPPMTPIDEVKPDPSTPPERSPELVPVPPPSPLPPQPEDLKIGVESSPHDSSAWLGSAKPTPHEAPRSEVAQPEASRTPGTPEPGSPTPPAPTPAAPSADAVDSKASPPPPELPSPAEPAPTTEPQPEPLAEPQPSKTPELSPEPPAGAEVPSPPQAGEAREATPPPPEAANLQPNPVGTDKQASPPSDPLPVDEWGDQMLLPIFRPMMRRAWLDAKSAASAATPAPKPTEPQAVPAPPPTTPSSPPALAAGTGAGAEKGRPGAASTKDSDPFALEETLTIKPGEPAAPEGLQIETVAPEFNHLSVLTGRPKNPIIELKFNAKGVVDSAEFYKGFDTGRRDFDDPVLQCVHRWTIKGKRLDELRRVNPKGHITIKVRMVLSS